MKFFIILEYEKIIWSYLLNTRGECEVKKFIFN